MMFAIAGLYGIALSLLIFSSIMTPFFIDLFVNSPYTLGSHGAVWEYWHGFGCLFVGIIAMLARQWPVRVQRQTAWALGFVYGAWGLQNLYLVLTGGFDLLMWVHVVGCLVVSSYAIMTGLRLRPGALLEPTDLTSDDHSPPQAT